MKYELKKLRDQVIVITGASSGIGLVTARMAARRGARLVLAARSEDSLRHIAEELSDQGSEVIHVAADVSREQDHRTDLRNGDESVWWIRYLGEQCSGVGLRTTPRRSRR